MIETESELNEKRKIKNLEGNIKELKKNSLINKYKQEIKTKKKLNDDEEFFNSDERIRIKKINETDELNKINDRYKQEIQELKEKLSDKKKEEEIYADIPYLETEEEAPERIADFHEKKGKGYVDLPNLLSKLNINSSKELISNIEQLINTLYNNKQINKQVYNIL